MTTTTKMIMMKPMMIIEVIIISKPIQLPGTLNNASITIGETFAKILSPCHCLV